MVETQQELLLKAAKDTEVVRGRALAEDLLGDLTTNGCGQWVTRAELRMLGWSERDIRQARQYSNGRIIFGQRGYRAAWAAEISEIEACARDLRARADKMITASNEVYSMVHIQKHNREQETNKGERQ